MSESEWDLTNPEVERIAMNMAGVAQRMVREWIDSAKSGDFNMGDSISEEEGSELRKRAEMMSDLMDRNLVFIFTDRTDHNIPFEHDHSYVEATGRQLLKLKVDPLLISTTLGIGPRSWHNRDYDKAIRLSRRIFFRNTMPGLLDMYTSLKLMGNSFEPVENRGNLGEQV